MKLKYSILGAIFVFLGLGVHAQITEMYYQGFESGETEKFSGFPSAGVRTSTSIYMSGERSLKLVQQSDGDVEVILDTLDFTSDLTLRYIALEFDHICPIKVNGGSGGNNVGLLYYKRANQTDWTKVSSQDYNIDRDVYSTDFSSTGTFSENSYLSAWQGTTITTNEMWRHERFDLDNVMTSTVPATDRKLIIKFVLKKRTLTSVLDTVNKAWFIDNLRISSSSERMVSPKIKMWLYPHMEDPMKPDGNDFPNSRGARIAIDATTSVPDGINPDSVYLFYRNGSDTSRIKLNMTAVTGVTNRYQAFIPYFGYDTMMSFYCVVKDKTGNENTATYPAAFNSWVDYQYVRGVAQPAIPNEAFLTSVPRMDYVFPVDADHRCQFIYDSTLMAESGYGPGGITALKFVCGAAMSSSQSRGRVQIRMKNIPTSYTVTTMDDDDYDSKRFENGYMHVVYDGELTIPALALNDTFKIELQDTFFYAGNDILLQVWYDHDSDPIATSLKMIPNASKKNAIFTIGVSSDYGMHAFTDPTFSTNDVSGHSVYRPVIIFEEVANQPLLYDAGVSELTTPNYYVAMEKSVGLIRVKLKNYGANTFNAVRISYNIDDTIFNYKDWTGTLAGAAEESVDLITGMDLPAGFHTLKVWVEDSVTASSVLYRDHEPYNDTMSCQFIVCDGPMGGVRNIGGDTPHFNDIEEFLFSLNRCGINDSLIVRLAPGCYPPFKLDPVTGLTEEHYIVFESMDSTNHATLYADTNYSLGAIANIEEVDNIRFRNLNFVRRSGSMVNMVKMTSTSTNCMFEGCSFVDSVENPVAAMRIDAMLDNSKADSMLVHHCTFVGGRVGVNVSGLSSAIYSHNIRIHHNLFNNQSENAVRVENMDEVYVEDNEMYDVLTNSFYVLQLNNLSGDVSIQCNKLYTSHGAGALSISGVEGTAENHVLVANNMMVGNDDGKAASMRNVVNVIQSSYIDYVYNATKLTAPIRINTAAVAFGPGMDNSRFLNNIVASMDSTNFALGYTPGTTTTNTVGHNVYYSGGSVLNRLASTSYVSLEKWKQTAVPDDTNSVSVQPSFLNGGLVDLRTFNRQMSGIGIPIEGVTEDMFGNPRDESFPCPGAFEFSALPFDFEPYLLINPVAENCDMPDQTELIVSLRNNGIDTLKTDNDEELTLHWTINGEGDDSYLITQAIPAEDTVVISTGHMLSLPPNGSLDAIYNIKVWVSSKNDPNQTNDTATYVVASRYHPLAPDSKTDSVAYASIDVIVPTGIDTWSVYGNTSSPKRRSKVYWYLDSITQEPFYIGDTLITDEVRVDTAFYVRQRRSMPIVRFTQIELQHVSSALGLTSPMPYWMADLRKAAVQLTNVGDAPANLKGDTLLMVSSSSTLNNKVYVFTDDVIIQPGKALIVQYAADGVTDTNLTIKNGISSFTMPVTPHIAFIYRHDGKVEDAVPFNDVMNSVLTVSWDKQNVPSYVWSGSAISFTGNVAGVVRTGFNGGVGDWNLSSDVPMSINSVKPSWIRYEDKGCEGDYAIINVGVIAPPVVELSLEEVTLPADGCDLHDEDVKVLLRNYGSGSYSDVVLNYCAGADTVSETVNGTLLSFSDTLYTFSNKLGLWFGKDSLVNLKVWVNAAVEDPMQENDTAMASVFSKNTPLAPDAIENREVPYATRDTLEIEAKSNMIPVWYDYDMNPVDTGYSHITDMLYQDGSLGVSFLVIDSLYCEFGLAEGKNSSVTFPSPYQSSSPYLKQQYIYSAADLTAAGLTPGYLKSLSFHVFSLSAPGDSIDFKDYTIALGATTDTIFTALNSWKPVSQFVYSRPVMTLYDSSAENWVEHKFDTPFYWDGNSSIVVQVTYSLVTNNKNVQTYYTSKQNACLYKYSNSALTPSLIDFSGNGNKANFIPDIRFTGTIEGCEGPITPIGVQIVDIPDVDVAIEWLDGFDTATFRSCDPVSLNLNVRNQGLNEVDNVKLYYYLDAEPIDSTIVTSSLASGVDNAITLFNRVLSPGIHSIRIIAETQGDNVPDNDTIKGYFIVRFCEGDYTIKADSTGDFASVKEAVEMLNVGGILGPVKFQVYQGTYDGRVYLRDVYSATENGTITFVGVDDNVEMIATTTSDSNFVFKVEGTDNVNFQKINLVSRVAAGNTSKSNVLVLKDANNVVVDDCYFKVSGSVRDTAASCISLQGNVSNISLLNSVMDSGGYAVRSAYRNADMTDIHISGNKMINFAYGALNLVKAKRLSIVGNNLQSDNTTGSRGLIGMFVATVSDSMLIDKNTIYLIDENTSAKRGIQLERISSTMLNPARVSNNMISLRGTDIKGLIPNKTAGIWVDSISSYVNVMFNTVQVYATKTITASANDLSYAFYCGNSVDHLQVMNNIFSNLSYGYAYYVSDIANVVSSNFNSYYTKAPYAFAWKTTDIATLGDLQATNADDGNSMFEEPYFVSDSNLHLLVAIFADKAQYTSDVYDDIDGVVRKQVPAPTIGAQELTRSMHDMSVARVSEPKLPANITTPLNIETDSVRVVVTLSNNGLVTESNVMWYAYVEGYEEETRSVNKNAGTFTPLQIKNDTLMMPTKVGIVNYQDVKVVVINDDDTVSGNNENNALIYLSPAFDITARQVIYDGGCYRTSVPIKLQIRNQGQKLIPAGSVLNIGYHAEVTSPDKLTIATMPDTVRQSITLDNNLNIGTSLDLSFTQPANLYPTDTAINIKVRVVGWCKYEHDILTANDTTTGTNSTVKDSYYTPSAPNGHDTSLAYGSWASLSADQANERPIRWYRDTNSTPFYSPSNYTASTVWGPTPQYFNDSTYFLNAISDKGCVSPFSKLKVSVKPQLARDMAVEKMITPLGKRVYMENDTVRVQVANYGTSAQGNVPITYVLSKGGTVLQTVTEYITSVAAGDVIVYKFNTLLDLPNPTLAQTFKLTAYTDLSNDGTRQNDTLQGTFTFSTLPQSNYNTIDEQPGENKTKFDITHFAFNDIDMTMPQLDRSYTNMADYDYLEFPPLHVRRGMTDSVLLEITPLKADEQRFRARVSISLDLNRDGYFDTSDYLTCQETPIKNAVFYSDSIFRSQLTIPACSELGYMRMRVKVMGYEADSKEGHVVDYMLFVDGTSPSKDLAISQIVTPHSPLLRNATPQVVSFRMDNRGTSNIDSVDIYYKYFDDNFKYDTVQPDTTQIDDSTYVPETPDTTGIGVYHWVGTLTPGQSTLVTLPARPFAVGNTELTIWHELEGDKNRNNDTIGKEFHRFHVFTLTFEDDFEGKDYWYAPKGDNEFSKNYWERGYPAKTRLNKTHSGDNAWVTGLEGNVVTGRRGNVSYLYSPVFNLAQIRADTIRFRMLRNITGGSTVTLEYYDYQDKWTKVTADSVLTWYNDESLKAFTGTSPTSGGYNEYWISANSVGLTGSFKQEFQLRFVLTTPLGTNNGAAFGEGCAIDNFEFIRARIPKDVGVVSIGYPESPRYGEVVAPKVFVKNMGLDTITNVKVAYNYYGSLLSKVSEVPCMIPPDQTQLVELDNSFLVTSDFPDSFYIRAYTQLAGDIYYDNDTAFKMVHIMPLDYDISAEEILAPLEKAVAGDTNVTVTLRMQNFGFNSISKVRAGYFVNGVLFTEEEINFDSVLGQPLGMFEYYNYTFNQKMTPSLGTNNITAYVKLYTDVTYEYNDTVTKRIQGLMSITDLAATGVVLDNSQVGEVHVSVMIENRGTQAANNFKVAFMVDDDTNTIVYETYKQPQPLQALTSGTHYFDYFLLQRPSGYNNVKAWVEIANDNDPTNDTTTSFFDPTYDLEVMKVFVEENAAPNCKVYLQVRNQGNTAIAGKQIRIHAKINGDSISSIVTPEFIYPGRNIILETLTSVPKRSDRKYTGIGYVEPVAGDTNRLNDTTYIVELVNFMEDIPEVEDARFDLEPNYPNPFTFRTTVPFTLPYTTRVRFFVLDAMGHTVYHTELIGSAGRHTVELDMSQYPAGVYFYGIEVNGQRKMRKMIMK